MLTAEERYRLLEEVAELSDRWEYQRVAERLSEVRPEYLLIEPELGHLFALSLYRTGRQRETAGWVAKLGEPCRGHSNQLHAKYLLMKGSIAVERGDLGEAQSVFERVAGLGALMDDHVLLASATMNMGVVQVIRCEWNSGLAAFQRAAAAYGQLGLTIEEANCAHNIGMVYRELGQNVAAVDSLNFALEQYVHQGNLTLQSVAESERALAYLGLGEAALALARIQRAGELALEANDLRAEGEVLRAVGIVERARGRLTESRAVLHRALMLARQTDTALLEGEVNEELSLVSALEGNEVGAERHAKRAIEIYHGMGAHARATRVEGALEGFRGYLLKRFISVST